MTNYLIVTRVAIIFWINVAVMPAALAFEIRHERQAGSKFNAIAMRAQLSGEHSRIAWRTDRRS
jgi:hypothetical protein